MSNLSRRNLLVRAATVAAAVPAVTVPALAVTAAPMPAALPPTPNEPTVIAKLWQQYEALQAEDDAASQKCDQLMREARCRAGAPDPGIRPSQAEEFGIRRGYVDHYIRPLGIQIALGELERIPVI